MPETQGWYDNRKCVKLTQNFNRFLKKLYSFLSRLKKDKIHHQISDKNS